MHLLQESDSGNTSASLGGAEVADGLGLGLTLGDGPGVGANGGNAFDDVRGDVGADAVCRGG